MSTTPAVSNTLPTLESLLKRIERLESLSGRTYILYYHYRSQRPFEKIFVLDGPLKDAIEEGKKHCSVMEYRFIKVRPFIVDFKDQEHRRNNDPYYDEDN